MGIVLHLSILSYASLICTSTSNEYEELLRNYDKHQPPSISDGSENAKIEVKARLYHLSISMPIRDPEEALTLEGHFHFVWKDKRLISEDRPYSILQLKLDEIWSAVPRVACRAGPKTLELGSGEEMRNSAVLLYNDVYDGNVLGRSVLIFRSMKACRSDLTDWPYDTKICNLRFISPAINGARVQYNPVLWKEALFESHGWDVQNVSFIAENNGSQIVLSFHLKRNGARHSPYYHLPAIANLLISLSFFFLEPHSRERFVLLLLVTIIQFYFLLTISLLAPHRHYFHRPKIEYFIEMTAIIILIQIFLVILCRYIIATEYNPSFLSKVESTVVMNRTLKAFFLLDFEPKVAHKLMQEEEDFLITTKNQTRKKWQLVSILIQRAAFYLLSILSLYLVYMVI